MAIVTAHVTAVQQLYVAYFNRPADYAGLDYWTNVVARNNGATTAVSAAFAAEAEYKTAYAGMTNAQIVSQVYQNLFGRPAETAGQTYWADLLTAGKITIDKVVAEIAKGAQTTDAEAYENKVAGAVAFTAALDTVAEQNGYRGAAANSQAKAFISSITTDATLAAAVAPATLDASVAKVVAAGTPFTLISGLAALEAAVDARTDFLDLAADGKLDGKFGTAVGATATDAANAIVAKVGTEIADLDLLVAGDYAAATAGVRAALLADQIAVNNTDLTSAQTLVNNANVEIAKVAGLSTAIATKTAADTAVTNAQKAVTAAAIDLTGKVAAFDFQNTTASKSVDVTVNANGTVSISTVTTTGGVAGAPVVTNLIVLTDGKLALASGVTETTHPGIGAVLAASTAQEAADATLASSLKAQTAAVANVNYLDMTATEVTNLQNLRAKMVEFADVSIAEGALPSLAQLATQKSILEANVAAGVAGAQAELDAFTPLLTTYEASATTNTRVAALTTANTAVTTATTTITNLTKATTELNAAVAANAQLTAVDASITAANLAFTTNGMTTPMEIDGNEVATAASDIFTVGDVSGQISLFGLQGKDSLFIGSDYTLNTGALTSGNNAVLEAFIKTAANGTDTVITLETSAFGSNAAIPEVVTITLVGVVATDVVLNNGIITLSTPVL